MRQAKDIDWQTRQLIKALEATLRRHLGAGAVETQFVTGLYWQLRQSLVDSGGFGSKSDKQGSAGPERLPLPRPGELASGASSVIAMGPTGPSRYLFLRN